jgi:hypothetical protein
MANLETPRTSITLQIYSIIMTMLAIICGAALGLNMLDQKKYRSENLELNNQMVEQHRMLLDAQDREQALMTALDYPQNSIGQFDVADPTTVLGGLRHDFEQLGLPAAPHSVRQALLIWKSEKDQTVKQDDSMQDQVRKLRELVTSIESRWSTLVNTERTARKDIEIELADAIANRTEVVEGKNRELQEMRKVTQQVQQQLNLLNEEIQKKDLAHNEQEKLLHHTINRLRDQLQTLKGELTQSLEPDAEIIRVDSFTQSVWMNRGDKDNLKPGIIFVITSNKSVNGNPKVKGRVRVTRNLEAHLAEAKIIDSDGADPLLKGDLLSSSLWSPGQIEKFAIAGVIDLDQDGNSDVEAVRTFIESSGAKVVTWVDENQNIQGDKINDETTALILGKTPDPTVLKSADLKEKANKALQQVTIMRNAANDYGIEVISLQKFLRDIGYPMPKDYRP